MRKIKNRKNTWNDRFRIIVSTKFDFFECDKSKKTIFKRNEKKITFWCEITKRKVVSR